MSSDIHVMRTSVNISGKRSDFLENFGTTNSVVKYSDGESKLLPPTHSPHVCIRVYEGLYTLDFMPDRMEGRNGVTWDA